MQADSQDLARQAIDGDRGALDELWRRHRRWVAAVILAYMPAGFEIDDLLQEAAMAMVRNISKLREAARLQPWLRRIAINTVRTSIRRHAVRQRHDRDMIERTAHELARGTTKDGAPAMPIDAARALDLLSALPVEYREILLLRAVRGLTMAQIARALELPEKTVETRVRRARRLMIEAAANTYDVSARDDAAPTDSSCANRG